MFGLETLDMLIGLVTVYLVFGLALTAIVASGTAASIAAAVKSLPDKAQPGKTQSGAGEIKRIKGLLDVLATQAGGEAAAFRKSCRLAGQYLRRVARRAVLVRRPAALHASARGRCEGRGEVVMTNAALLT